MRELEQSGVRGVRKADAPDVQRNSVCVVAQDRARSSAAPRPWNTRTAWTAGRVRELIEYRTGMRHDEDHVWRILRELGWTCQRLTGWALERDEEAIQQRKED
jgi:transposase